MLGLVCRFSIINTRSWAQLIEARRAVARKRIVSRFWGDSAELLNERHDARDIELQTQDKIEAEQ